MEEQPIADELCVYLEGNTGKNWTELRITDLDGSVTKEKVIEWCKTQSLTYLGGEETAQNHHFHLAIPYEKDPKMLVIRDSLYDVFKPPKKGNAFFSTKPVTNIERYLPYCVKDGLYFSSSNLEGFMEFIYEISFVKPLGYLKDCDLFFDQYQSDEISKIDLWEKLCLARGFYNLRLNLRALDELVDAQTIKKDPALAKIQSKLRTLI